MQLAILHYHLNPGGVTKVVQNHLHALAGVHQSLGLERVVLVYGGRAIDWPQEELAAELPFALELLPVEGLDYDSPDRKASDALGQAIHEALLQTGFSPDNTLLHWHNPALGKNASTPRAVGLLASEGYRTLVQVHDFAEDFRPSNYRFLAQAISGGDTEELTRQLYPQAEQIHYATLNGRDQKILATAGVAPNRLHLLPNPVSAPPVDPDPQRARQRVYEALKLPASHRLITYPVRGIRRKNLGEFLLWSAAVENSSWIVTLAPQNPAELVSFERWKEFAEEFDLPSRMGTPPASRLGFGQMLAACDFLLTTSVAEGFGMIFLETWLAGKELLGRDLPEITADIKHVGVTVDALYTELRVPSAWIGLEDYLSEMSQLVRETYAAFGRPLPENRSLEAALAEMLNTDAVDFAQLPSKLQKTVVARVAEAASAREELLHLNPLMRLPPVADEGVIARNAEVVREHFSFPALGDRLATAYRELSGAPCQGELSPLPRGHAVLNAFLEIDRLHVIRVES